MDEKMWKPELDKRSVLGAAAPPDGAWSAVSMTTLVDITLRENDGI